MSGQFFDQVREDSHTTVASQIIHAIPCRSVVIATVWFSGFFFGKRKRLNAVLACHFQICVSGSHFQPYIKHVLADFRPNAKDPTTKKNSPQSPPQKRRRRRRRKIQCLNERSSFVTLISRIRAFTPFKANFTPNWIRKTQNEQEQQQQKQKHWRAKPKAA